MIYTFLDSAILGIICGLIAAIYRNVLAYEEPFTAWWRFGARFENRFFFKPIWGCDKCIAGQLALWGYLAHGIGITAGSPSFEWYSFTGHIFAVSVAIFSAIIFSRIINNNQ